MPHIHNREPGKAHKGKKPMEKAKDYLDKNVGLDL